MESSNAFVESLSIEQQSQVFDLMAITNIEDSEIAVKLLRDSNFNMNAAVQQWLDRNLERNRTTQSRPSASGQQTRSQESELHTKYKNFLDAKTKKEEQKGVTGSLQKGVGTVMMGVKSAWNSFIPTSIRGETIGGEQFILYLKKNYPDLNKLKFNLGTFEENIWQIKETGRPLLVYFHLPNEENKKIPSNLFKQKSIVDFMNSKFFLLGLLGNTEEARKIEQYVDPKNYPCIAAFRLNLIEEIVLIEIFNLTCQTTPQEFLGKIEAIHRAFWLKVAEEDKVKQEVKRAIDIESRGQLGGNILFSDNNFIQQNNGQMFPFFEGNANPNPQPQISAEEQARREQDRILRQIQEEEFKEVERKIIEQQLKETEDEIIRNEKIEKEESIRKQKEEEDKRKGEQKLLTRKLKLENLPEEPAEGEADTIAIIFRLPNGQRIERRFKNNNKIQVLYDFIDTKEIEFDSSTVRYDLIQPMPFLCLEDNEKTLNDYFEGSQNEIIHIREMHE